MFPQVKRDYRFDPDDRRPNLTAEIIKEYVALKLPIEKFAPDNFKLAVWLF